jgi:tetratricopeptide (TPR) repeat protein
MPQPMPVVRQLAWSQLIPQALAIALLGLIFYLLFSEARLSTVLFGAAITYLIICRISRAVILREHYAGMSAYRAGRFTDAINHFEVSYAFFSRHPRMDSWRSFLFGVAGHNRFRIVALCNMAFCYSQLGEGSRAITLYEQALAASPSCTLARAGLNMLRSTSASSDARKSA